MVLRAVLRPLSTNGVCCRALLSAEGPSPYYTLLGRALLSTKAPAPKKAAGGGKKDGGGKGPKGGDIPMPTSKDVVPVNYLKDGKDPPLLPDDQYPDWLFEMRPLTISEYEKLDLNQLPLSEQRRYFKLLNRQVIRENRQKGSGV